MIRLAYTLGVNIKILLTILLLLLLPCWASGATYYVSTSGSDTNNGTSVSTPWRHHPWMKGATGTADATVLTAGDTMYFKKGDEFTDINDQINTWTNGSDSGYITTKTHPTWGAGDNALICPTRSWTSGWTNHSGNVWKRMAGDSEHPIAWIWFGSVSKTNAGTMERSKDDLDAEKEFTYNTDNPNSGIWDSDDKVLYIYTTTDPNTQTIYYSGHLDYSPIKLDGATAASDWEYHKWENLRLWGGAGGAVYYIPDTSGSHGHITVSGCDLRYTNVCWLASVTIYASALFSYNTSVSICHITLENNTFNTCSRSAINLCMCANPVIRGNTITNIGRGFLAEDMTCYLYGARFFYTNDGIMENNIIYYDGSGTRVPTGKCVGVHLDRKDETKVGLRNIVRYNKVVGFKKGLFDENCDDSELYYNLVDNSWVGLDVGGTWADAKPCDKVFYNNTVYNCDCAIRHFGKQQTGTKSTFKDNLALNCTIYAYVGSTGQDGTIAFDYNGYDVDPATPNKFHWQGAYMDFNTWDDSRDQNGICQSDLGVIDPANGNFSLTQTSPCIDAGTDVGLIRDYDGHGIYGTAWDIGAFEYSPSPLAPPMNLKITSVLPNP